SFGPMPQTTRTSATLGRRIQGNLSAASSSGQPPQVKHLRTFLYGRDHPASVGDRARNPNTMASASGGTDARGTAGLRDPSRGGRVVHRPLALLVRPVPRSPADGRGAVAGIQ